MSQRDRVLEMLERAGAYGVTTAEFLREYLYEFRSRITELRQRGHKVSCERLTAANYRYRLEA